MDEHPGVEANAHASRSLESLTIMTTTTPATQTAQEPRPKSPCSLAGNQTPSMFTDNPAWSMIPGVSPTPSEQTLRDQQQLLLQATGETPQSPRSCFAFAGISSSPSLQTSSAPSSPSPLFTPIPLPKLTSSKGTQTHWPDAPTTEEPAQVEATTPQQSAHLPREETGPSALQEPQASVPPPQTPERSPTAPSQPPSHPPSGASQTFYPTMAAPYGWSPAAQ
ncbi:hypothetical protein NUW58_g5202 [Xylaria curta]|uniref:Uncharacterized protein n=1 Tax=Xylaria curta TaxID=42375 RepID=A0ACC1P2R3_9PEZI|nr:hypothetical protein NUW58_g5202 [Xylaria curta]